MARTAPTWIPDGAAQADENLPPAEAVRTELRRILQSSAFRGSQRSQSFLRYVVEKKLAAQAADLKERHLAVELFGRLPGANLAEDTIVRVTAREVRRRLQQYYASAESAGSVLRIHLPLGGYVPEFRPVDPMAEQLTDLPDDRGAPVTGRSPRRGLLLWLGASVLAAGVILGLLGWFFFRKAEVSSDAPLAELFWRPVMSSNGEVVIGVPDPHLPAPSVKAAGARARMRPALEVAYVSAPDFPAHEAAGSDFVAVPDQYVTFGDLLAVSHLHAMLARRGKDVRLKFSGSITPAELKHSPAIQIGAHRNPWTRELGRDLRFRFGHTPDGRSCIFDTNHADRFWVLPTAAVDGPAHQDYLLITRLVSQDRSQPAVLVAGLTPFGAAAAAQWLSNPRRLEELLRSIQKVEWAKANIQLVVETRLVGHTPTAVQLVAWHVW